jgi:hypothetical protein
MAGKGLELPDKELRMVGENTFILNQAEMVRALMFSSEKGNARVGSVRQKGAHLENVFIIEIADKPKTIADKLKQ